MYWEFGEEDPPCTAGGGTIAAAGKLRVKKERKRDTYHAGKGCWGRKLESRNLRGASKTQMMLRDVGLRVDASARYFCVSFVLILIFYAVRVFEN